VGTPRPLVLDAGALIAFERGDPRMRALLLAARRIVVPAGALAQVWRDGKRQVLLRALCNSARTEVPALDRATAEAAGILCSRARTRDVIDASVVLAGRQEHALVVTSDPDDIRRIDPTLCIAAI
jgi:hypothetical protein